MDFHVSVVESKGPRDRLFAPFQHNISRANKGAEDTPVVTRDPWVGY